MIKKIALLITVLFCGNATINMSASADSMYNNLMESFINNTMTIEEKIEQIQNIQRRLKDDKESLQRYLLRKHAQTFETKLAAFKPASFCLIACNIGYVNCSQNILSVMPAALSITFGAVLFLLFEKPITLYLYKRQIQEMDAVIAKLEIAKNNLDYDKKYTRLILS